MRSLRRRMTLGLAAAGLVLVAGCSSDLETIDSGGVTLVVSDFDLSNLTDPLSATEFFPLAQGSSVTVTSIITGQGDSSQLMTVQIEGYEVTYRRGDTGTRVPPAFIQNIFGVVAAGGTFDLNGLNLLRADQFNAQPINDLMNRGFDTETGSSVVRLVIGIRFFGKTVSGRAVQSNTALLTMDIVQ